MGLDKNETKEALKEAIKEYLDEKVTSFGWLSLGVLGAAAVCALLYFILTTNGWSIVKTPLELK